MENKDLYDAFLKSLKVALTNASIYFEEHPAFLRSVEKLKEHTDTLIRAVGVVSIGFTRNSLLIEDEYLEGENLYESIAFHFHRRKIKKIVIEEGYTGDEMTSFLRIVALPYREIFKKGGVVKLGEEALLAHIVIEELDYSEFISQIAHGGSEEKDIWKCIIDDIYTKKGFSPETGQFLANFNEVLSNFTYEDIEGDPRLVDKLIAIIKYAERHNPEGFRQWSKKLTEFFLRDNRCLYNREVAEKVEDFFRNLSAEVLGEAVWESNFANKKFDPLTLKLFSRLLEEKQNESVSSYIAERLQDKPSLLHDRETREGLKNLFENLGEDFVSKPYRNTLSGFMESIREFGNVNVEYTSVYDHYHQVVLLNLLDFEETETAVQMVIKSIKKEFGHIFGRNDFPFIRNVISIIDTKLSDERLQRLHPLYRGCREEIIRHIKDNALEMVDGMGDSDFDSFLKMVGTDFVDVDSFVSYIVSATPPSFSSVKFFFRIFPDKTNRLIEALKSRLDNFEYMRGVIEALKGMDNTAALDFLKEMFGMVNPLLKIEILKVMRHLSTRDYRFLFNILSGGDIFLKREALKILKHESPEMIRRGLRYLFQPVRWFFVPRRVVYDNLQVIKEENMAEAIEILSYVKNRIFLPWDSKIKRDIEETINFLKRHA